MIYPIVLYGDPILKKISREITRDDFLDIKELVNDMFETMYAAKGVGLAAPQIGKNIRVFIIDPEYLDSERLKNKKKVFINPKKIKENGDDFLFEEGCLSIPDIRGEIVRYDSITLHFFDQNWKEYTETFTGLIARVIQHEYDHLEGKLFIEYFKPLRKQLIKNKLQMISRGKVKTKYLTRIFKGLKKKNLY